MRESRRLLALFRGLSAGRRAALLEYAEFLASREQHDVAEALPTEPLPIPRPAQENVVKAIQRLMQTYPMLDRNRIFHEASAQMTRHLVHGIAATEVIDELECIFTRHYQLYVEARDPEPG